MESKPKTTKSASTKPHPGNETWREEMKKLKGHSALAVRVRTAQIRKMKASMRGTVPGVFERELHRFKR